MTLNNHVDESNNNWKRQHTIKLAKWSQRNVFQIQSTPLVTAISLDPHNSLAEKSLRPPQSKVAVTMQITMRRA